MLNIAISFFPALRIMGPINLKGDTVPFPVPVAEEQHSNNEFNLKKNHLHRSKTAHSVFTNHSLIGIYLATQQ